jgi:predicted small lipoprotein YifL
MTAHKVQNQYFSRMMIILCVALLSSTLTACGVKPGHLAPPPGAENDGFPHTYPAPNDLPR